MDSTDKTVEELRIELIELRNAYNLLKAQCENGMSVLQLAEANARLSEEKYMKAFMTSPDSVNINRLSDGMYVSVNEGFINMLGFSEEEVIGKTSLELNIWADPENRKALVAKLRKDGRVDNLEALFRHKDGRIIIGLMSASVIDLEGVAHSLNITKDITTRKQIEEALLNEQFLVNALMDSLPDHIYFKDLESRFIRNSKSHILSFGFSDPSEVVGKTDFDFFNSEDAQKAFDDEQKIIKTGQSIRKEEKFTRTDNTVVWFMAEKLPLRDKNGNIIGTFGISRDITEQKKTEEALKKSEERFRSVTQSAIDAIISVNSKGIILGWNQGAENTFGYNEVEIIGQSLNLIIPDDYLGKHIKGFVLLELRGEPKAPGKTIELIGKKKNGENFPLELSLSSWETSEGKFFTGIIRDISRRKRTELENNVLYQINQGITTTSNLDELLKLIHSSLGKVSYAENFFVALMNEKTGLFSFPYFVDKFDTTPLPTSMGKSCSSYVFRTVKPFLFSQQEFDRLEKLGEVELVGSPSPSWVAIPLQTPFKVLGVMVLQHYEKENVYSEDDMKFLVSIGGQIAFAIERKLAETEIKLKNELLQTLNSEKDKFFSILAHDLRGPLSAFVAATQIITEEVQSMTIEEIKEITLSMTQSASGIYSLLENLLEWSRLQRGVMDFIPEKINLKKRINECINVLTESAKKKEIKIDAYIDDNLEALADKHMFDAIVRNLISNAIKFTKTGGVVSISAKYDNENATEIRITDSGIGMSPELKNKLFKIDEKTSRPGTDGEPSTGLGLLLCKEFIEKHGGEIWVESEVGKGTTFAFKLP
jgi:PAS domain S-box-containing protein